MSRGPSVTTTLKLDTCSYSDQRLYPGRGITFISRDGKPHIFANHKCSSLFHQRIKPAKLTWTQAWRRANKKATASVGQGKKKTRRAAPTGKALAGNLEMQEFQQKKLAAQAASQTKSADGVKRAPLASNKKKPAKKPAAN